MCIFSQPVISVDATRIFARRSGRGTQFLVYQMRYESQEENAMILPVPVRQPSNEERLNFIDLRDYETFFDDLDEGFPYVRPPFSIGCSGGGDWKDASLEVHEVGNYIASWVPSIADFAKLDPRFTLPLDTLAKVPQYANFGFAVFQLASGALKPHPMAFEFQTDRDELFFPTLHIHDGEVHDKEQFDHVLYAQHAGFDSRVYDYRNSNVPDKSTGLVRSKEVASSFCDVGRANGVVAGALLVHRKVIYGEHPNRDTEFPVSGDPMKRAFNLRFLWSYLPWAVVVAGVAWFFNRRSRIKSRA